MSNKTEIFLPYEILLLVFKFLNYKDLWKAARVNSFWNKVANDSALWKKFAPEETCLITNFPLMMSRLKEVKITHLNLKNVLFEKRNIKCVLKRIEGIESLEEVKLPQCSVDEFEQIYFTSSKIRSLSVKIFDQERFLSVQNILNLTHLRKLHFSNMSNEKIYVRDIQCLVQLNKHLSSLKLHNIVADNFGFVDKMRLKSFYGCIGSNGLSINSVSSMQNLERFCLELNYRSSEIYETIKTMKNLKHLQLLDTFDYEYASVRRYQLETLRGVCVETALLQEKSTCIDQILEVLPQLTLDVFALGLSRGYLFEYKVKHGGTLEQIQNTFQKKNPNIKTIVFEYNFKTDNLDFKNV